MASGPINSWQIDSILKSRDITLQTKVYIVKAVGFPVIMYECESWTIKKAELWRIDTFELWCWIRLLRVPWTARRSNQSILVWKSTLKIHWEDWCEAEAPILRPPDAKSWLTGEDSEIFPAGKDWGQQEKQETKDKMVGWHHWLNGHEFAQTPGDGEGQGSLACCSPWGHKELDMI